MPSAVETLFVRGSAVGEVTIVAVMVGGIVSIADVEVGMAVGGRLVGVDAMTGAGVAVQALRRIKATTNNFFIASNYMPYQTFALRGCYW
jgi:hypothetical protein